MGTALPFNLGTLAWRAVCVFGVGVGNKTCASEEGAVLHAWEGAGKTLAKRTIKTARAAGAGAAGGVGALYL